MGQQYPKMQRDYELEKWKNRAQSLKKKLWILAVLLLALAIISLAFFELTKPQVIPDNQASPIATITTTKPDSSALKPLAASESVTASALPSTSNIAIFEASYKKPDGCDNPPDMKMMVECSNHYIRAKNKFLASQIR